MRQHQVDPQATQDYRQSIAEQIGYSRDSKLVIIHADDIALSQDATDASLQAMEWGMVKSGSIMVPCPDFERASAIWKKNRDLDFGIHLSLTCEWGAKHPWSPVLPRNEVPTLYNSNGCMWPDYLSLSKHMNTREALMEMEAQINKVLQDGLNPTHLDAHMSIYLVNKVLYKGVLNLSKKYMMPARVSNVKRHRI
ncbi:MAG: ChbG/HpnK family deacetylase, partial [Syntrophales bacterium]